MQLTFPPTLLKAWPSFSYVTTFFLNIPVAPRPVREPVVTIQCAGSRFPHAQQPLEMHLGGRGEAS